VVSHIGIRTVDGVEERQQAFEALYERGFGIVVRACVGFTASSDYAFDIAQDAFVRTFLNWERAVKSADPLYYTIRVARNLSARRRWRRGFSQRILAKMSSFGRREHEGVESETYLDALAAIRSLPQRQREVIVLCALLEFDSSEAAQVLGISPSTIRVHLARARNQLRIALSRTKEGVGDEPA
jgi:RNA polymerase sigma-70 factor (ECF subfamily)